MLTLASGLSRRLSLKSSIDVNMNGILCSSTDLNVLSVSLRNARMMPTMVARVTNSSPSAKSDIIIIHLHCSYKQKSNALTGNRTRASRVAGENSTTEPSVLTCYNLDRNYR